MSEIYKLDKGTLTYEIYDRTVDGKNEKYIVITGGKDLGPCLILPDYINNIPVQIIGPQAFKFNEKIQSVKVPNTVTNICSDAFLKCENLESVDFSKNLLHIEYCAFRGCSKLKEVDIPASVFMIGESAFEDCISLEKVTFHEGLNVILESAFYNCILKNLELPNSLTKIHKSAFERSGVQTVVFGKELKEIHERVFYHCEQLVDVKFNEKLQSIDERAFSECSSLKTFVLPDSLTRLGYEVVDNCVNLRHIHIGQKLSFPNTPITGDFAFGTSSLEKITVSPENKSLIVVDGILYDKEKKLLMKVCPHSPITSVTIPEWTKCAFSLSFSEIETLKTITFKCSSIENINMSGVHTLEKTLVRCLPGSPLEKWCVKNELNVKSGSQLDNFLNKMINNEKTDKEATK